MTLGDLELIPGVVIDVSDPLNQGRVKAVAPGVFDTSTMGVEDLFWINPFMMTGHQTFSKLEINSKIWILHNSKNYFEYWYIPMFEFSNIQSDNAAVKGDVVYSRSVGGNKVSMGYNEETGTTICNGGTSINVDPDNISAYALKDLKLLGENVYIGKGMKDTNYHIARAEAVQKAFNNIGNTFLIAAGIAAVIPFTSPVAGSLLATGLLFNANPAFEEIPSPNIKIN